MVTQLEACELEVNQLYSCLLGAVHLELDLECLSASYLSVRREGHDTPKDIHEDPNSREVSRQ